MRRVALLFLTLGLASCTRSVVVRDPSAQVEEWPAYGNDAGSSRYSRLTEINRQMSAGLRLPGPTIPATYRMARALGMAKKSNPGAHLRQRPFSSTERAMSPRPSTVSWR